jgi:glycosyltransferase involved in cell wall biosynthesis
VLARAVPDLLENDLEATIVFVGPSVDARTGRILQALADRHPGRVEVEGRVPHDQVLALLAGSYALVAPSFYEICPMAVLEAMALGVPTVAANAGPMAEIVEDGVSGLLFPAGNADALGQSLLGLLNSPHTRMKMAEAAHSRFIASYDMHIVMDRLVAFYGRIAWESVEVRP